METRFAERCRQRKMPEVQFRGTASSKSCRKTLEWTVQYDSLVRSFIRFFHSFSVGFWGKPFRFIGPYSVNALQSHFWPAVPCCLAACSPLKAAVCDFPKSAGWFRNMFVCLAGDKSCITWDESYRPVVLLGTLVLSMYQTCAWANMQSLGDESSLWIC